MDELKVRMSQYKNSIKKKKRQVHDQRIRILSKFKAHSLIQQVEEQNLPKFKAFLRDVVDCNSKLLLEQLLSFLSNELRALGFYLFLLENNKIPLFLKALLNQEEDTLWELVMGVVGTLEKFKISQHFNYQ